MSSFGLQVNVVQPFLYLPLPPHNQHALVQKCSVFCFDSNPKFVPTLDLSFLVRKSKTFCQISSRFYKTEYLSRK